MRCTQSPVKILEQFICVCCTLKYGSPESEEKKQQLLSLIWQDTKGCSKNYRDEQSWNSELSSYMHCLIFNSNVFSEQRKQISYEPFQYFWSGLYTSVYSWGLTCTWGQRRSSRNNPRLKSNLFDSDLWRKPSTPPADTQRTSVSKEAATNQMLTDF